MGAGGFEAALARVLAHEGGYVDHPSDPGGATNMGITHATLAAWRGRPVSKADVRALGQREAAAIYRARYWEPIRGDDLPGGLDYATFDAAVHSGPSRAVRWLQAALGVARDGIVGPVTLAAARAAGADALDRAVASRRAFLMSLAAWPTFGRGWGRRLDEVAAGARAMLETNASSKKETDMLQDEKPWYLSRGVWGAIVALIGLAAGMAGFTLGEEDRNALGELLAQLAATLGALVALIGRVAARRRIG